MRELQWDPLDFLTVLEVEPQDFSENYGTIVYLAARDSLELGVVVSPSHRSLQITLGKDGTNLLKVTVCVFGAIRRVFDVRGEFLEINDCVLISDWSCHLENESQSKAANRDVIELRIFLKPHIQIIFG